MVTQTYVSNPNINRLKARLAHLLSQYFDFIVLSLTPIFLILLNSNWVYTPSLLTADAWFNTAYFRYFDIYAPTFPSNIHYFVERLTWIVPGYYAYKVFHPLVANFILHLYVYYMAIFSIFGTLTILFNRRAALISAIVMGCYPFFLRAVGWDYVDGIGLAFFSLLIYLLSLATRSSRWKLQLLLAGMVHASMIITYLFWVGLAPIWALFFLLQWFINRRIKWKEMVWAGLLFIAGNIILTCIASLYYHEFTGNFNFLENTIRYSRLLIGDQKNITAAMTGGLGQMIPFWHLFPMVVAITAMFYAYKTKHSAYRLNFITVAFTFAMAYGCFIFWHFYSFPYLNIFLYCSFLIPATFLLLGAILADSLVDLSTHEFRWLSIMVILILASPLLLCVLLPSLEKWQGNIGLALAASILVIWGLRRCNQKVWLLACIIGMTALFYIGALKIKVYLSDRNRGRDDFILVNAVASEIDTHFPRHEYSSFRLWYKKEGGNFDAITNDLASIYLYPWGSTVYVYPNSNFQWPSEVQAKTGNVILITSDSDVRKTLKEANQALNEQSVTLLKKSSWSTNYRGQNITLIFTRMNILPISIQYDQKFEFDRYIDGKNWYTPEKAGGTWVWSGPGLASTINFKLPSIDKDTQIEFCSISTTSADIPGSLRLMVNGTVIPVTLSNRENCPFFYSATIRSDILAKNALKTKIVFQVLKTTRPGTNDLRELGLAFDWMQFREAK